MNLESKSTNGGKQTQWNEHLRFNWTLSAEPRRKGSSLINILRGPDWNELPMPLPGTAGVLFLLLKQ